jgi:uncharacterized protein (DUF1330 family)
MASPWGKETGMPDGLQKEFEYYLAHQSELVETHGGKVLVIKDQKVIGEYDNELEAVRETVKAHPLGTFLVQRCSAGEEEYTQTFHSRVSFG